MTCYREHTPTNGIAIICVNADIKTAMAELTVAMEELDKDTFYITNNIFNGFSPCDFEMFKMCYDNDVIKKGIKLTAFYDEHTDGIFLINCENNT